MREFCLDKRGLILDNAKRNLAALNIQLDQTMMITRFRCANEERLNRLPVKAKTNCKLRG